jgi:hypothetical protein
VWTYPQFAQQIPIDLLGVFAGTTTGTSTAVAVPTYSASSVYYIGHKVVYGGSIYVSTINYNLNHTPPNVSYWALSTADRYPFATGNSNGEMYLCTDVSPPQTFIWYLNTWYPLATSGGGGASYVSPPATATSSGAPGSYAADATYFYICTAIDTWRRVAIAAW